LYPLRFHRLDYDSSSLVRRLRPDRGSDPSKKIAPVAAIVSIDMTPGQRLRRAIELIVGATVGVGVGALLISAMGQASGMLGQTNAS
jgi:hypothetical protein